MEVADPYGFHAITPIEADEIRLRLAAFESMTWREIVATPSGSKGRPPNHLMPVDQLKCDKALKRLEEIAPDVDTLMSLRVSGPQRIWGVMYGSTCQLLFWDPDHQIYPIEKK